MSAYSITTRGLPQGTLTPMGALLFAASEPGAWYDPSDMSTLFQDAAGTTPVTAVEQPVGRVLDKSGRGNHATQSTTTKRPMYSRRVNTFVASENLLAAAWIAANGAVKVTDSRLQFAGNNSQAYQNVPMAPVVGTTYRFEAVLSGAGTMTMVIGFPGGVYEEWVQPITLSATPTLFVMESTLAQAGHTACNASLSKGTGSAPEVTVHQTSLRPATDAHLPYQWVNTATDYDADPAKFPAYLRFDGVDDALQTGNIDFTSTDKMTVWAGVTKIGDAVRNPIIEVGGYGVAQGFGLYSSPHGLPNQIQAFHAAANAVHVYAAATPPNANYVLGLQSDLSAPKIAIRRSGVAAAESTASPGVGTYGNLPASIGSGTGGFYFNGRLYSLIVRGAQSSLSQIEATELYIKQKMRLP